MSSLPQVSIRSSGAEKAHHIALLHAKLFSTPWSQEFLQGLLQKKTTLSFEAYLDNQDMLAGFLLGSLAADEAEILTLGVDKQFHRRGIASELMSTLIRKLKDNHAERVFLEMSVNNLAANGLYRKYGFEVVGRRRNYYETSMGSQGDAVIMSLSL